MRHGGAVTIRKITALGQIMKCFLYNDVWRRFSVLLLITLLVGCAAGPERAELPVGTRLPLVEGDDEVRKLGWWPVCFRMPFGEDGKPGWAVDLLLAHQVVGPLLREHEESIALWRFHRRAGRDATGHQLTLLAYTDDETGAALMNTAQSTPLVVALQRAGHLREVVNTCRGELGQTALNAHSDPVWDERLERTWPYFIMGVSAHWLALIDEVSRGQGAVPGAVEPMLGHYRTVQEEVTEIWRLQGRHAYLHHLNAIFGYEPLLIQRLMGF